MLFKARFSVKAKNYSKFGSQMTQKYRKIKRAEIKRAKTLLLLVFVLGTGVGHLLKYGFKSSQNLGKKI